MMNNPFANMQQMIGAFNQFKQSFKGNANQQIQQLMNAGKVNQSQYNQAVQMAQQFQKMLTGR